MTPALPLSTLATLSILGLACGEVGHLGLDPNKPANELTEDEYLTLCDEAYSPLRSEAFVDDSCVYEALGSDPERCEESVEVCRSIGGIVNGEDIDALCMGSRARDNFDCSATVGQYLDCIRPYNSALARFMAGVDCSSPRVAPPYPEDVPACEPLVSICGPVFFLY